MVANAKMDAMHKFIVVSGFIALILSILMGAQFYASLAHNTVGTVIYVSAGALLTCLVVLTLSIALYSFQRGFVIMGTMLAILWVLLFFLEMMAEFGFLATQQERRAQEVAKDSTQARLAEEAVKTAGARVDNLAQYAGVDINAVQGELASLQAELDGAQARLSGCPANFKTKCINPARADITRISKEMEPLEAQVNGYQSYQAALASKASAGKELGEALNGKDVGLAISPGYTWFARLSTVSAENIQAGTSFLIAFLLSMWASFAGFILLRIKGEGMGDANGMGNGGYQVTVAAPAPAPAQGYLTKDDLDVLLTQKLSLLAPPVPAASVSAGPK